MNVCYQVSQIAWIYLKNLQIMEFKRLATEYIEDVAFLLNDSTLYHWSKH